MFGWVIYKYNRSIYWDIMNYRYSLDQNAIEIVPKDRFFPVLSVKVGPKSYYLIKRSLILFTLISLLIKN